MAKLILAVLLVTFCVHCKATSEDVADAQAALALAKAKTTKCVCNQDIEKCREESKKTGKPLVLAVNVDCKGLSAKFFPNVIFCKVKSYVEEGQSNPEASRFVVLSPDAKQGPLFIRNSFQPDVKYTELESALKSATKVKAPKPLDWK